MFVLTNAIFFENDYMINFKPRSKVVLEELPGDVITRQPTKVFETREEEENTTHHDITWPRRSGTIVRQLTRYGHDGETNVVITDTDVDDPLSHHDVMRDIDKEQWLEAMNLDMQSMYSNSVWELVDPLNMSDPLGTNRFSRKREVRMKK